MYATDECGAHKAQYAMYAPPTTVEYPTVEPPAIEKTRTTTAAVRATCCKAFKPEGRSTIAQQSRSCKRPRYSNSTSSPSGNHRTAEVLHPTAQALSST